MDYDKIAEELKDKNVTYSEVSRYITKPDGSMFRETIFIDYFAEGDYQWTTSVKPIFSKSVT